MARPREPADWDRDLAGARSVERRVATALAAHPEIRRFSDFTAETEIDFEFEFERGDVRLDVKEKHESYSEEICEQWREVPADDLFVMDETSFRQLVWAEGLGYLVIHDRPGRRWCVFGPWELCLGPRRRFERRGDRGAGEFLKGKLLVDLRSAAAVSATLDVGLVLDTIRTSRAALRRVRAVAIRGQADLPVIPKTRDTTDTVPTDHIGSEPAIVELDARWGGLSTDLVNRVQAQWGWKEPTEIQRVAFGPLLSGHNALVLSPTAGGKTEAAMLPLLDLWRQEGWGSHRPSILVISPLRALLDDQLERWQRGGALVGATAFAWHGDVSSDQRKAFRDSPADCLLTTPESLENFLSSPAHDERALFAGLRSVLVDEVHAFVGTSRGAQLAGLLERLDEFTEADLQRIGLSATVGNPAEVVDWLRGGSLREHVVVQGVSPVQGEELDLRSYEGLPEAISAVRSAVGAERAIVFTRSRRRAEELANGLSVPRPPLICRAGAAN